MDTATLIMLLLALGLWSLIAFERRLQKLPVPLPLIYVGVGYAVFALPLGLPVLDVVGSTAIGPASRADPAHAIAAEHLTELIVIISLLAAGLAIDRPFSLRRWGQVWPLLAIAMPLTIAVVALLGWWWMGLPLASAVLLGAVLSPTDPVLARSVQVGPPGTNERDDVRFDLTVEAGFNDSLAFPFVYLALAMGTLAVAAPVEDRQTGVWVDTLLRWLALDVFWRVLAGLVVGVAVGRAAAWFAFRQMRIMAREDAREHPWAGGDRGQETQETQENQEAQETQAASGGRPSPRGESVHEHAAAPSVDAGLLVLATLFAAYALAEAVGGYGFLAVFVGGVAARQVGREHGLHARTHEFIDQVERVALVVLLLGFGGLLASGVLGALTWPGAALAVALVLVVRPLAGWLSLLGCPLPALGVLAVACLGVRGIGTLYYISYAYNHAQPGAFPGLERVWAVSCLAILLSMLVHGVAANPMLSRAKARGHHVIRHPRRDDSGLEAGG